MVNLHDSLAHPQLRSRVWEYFGVEFDPQFVTDTPLNVIPDGAIKLMFHRKPMEGVTGLRLIGNHTRQRSIMPTGGDKYWAVQVVPGTAATWLPGLTDCITLRNTICNAADILGEWATMLCKRLQSCESFQESVAIFDEALLPLLPQAKPLDEAVMRAVEAIVHASGEISSSDLVARVGLSERQLLRRFTCAVGLTPKQFSRAWRIFSATVQATRTQRLCWSAIAAELGFSDQAHLSHEFVDLLGLTPQQFAQQRHTNFYNVYAAEPLWNPDSTDAPNALAHH